MLAAVLFRPVVIIPVLTLIIFIIQFFTGFFIEPEAQVFILYTLNMIARILLGREIFTGNIKPILLQRYEITSKKLYESKTFWLLMVGLISAVMQIMGKYLGKEIDIVKYNTIILSTITFFISLITKKPVVLK